MNSLELSILIYQGGGTWDPPKEIAHCKTLTIILKDIEKCYCYWMIYDFVVV